MKISSEKIKAFLALEYSKTCLVIFIYQFETLF